MNEDIDVRVIKEIFNKVVIYENGQHYIDNDGTRSTIPPFSTDIEKAYLILKHFERQGYEIHVQEENGWKFTLQKNDKTYSYVCKASLPMSICLVFLEHVRQMKESNKERKQPNIIEINFRK